MRKTKLPLVVFTTTLAMLLAACGGTSTASQGNSNSSASDVSSVSSQDSITSSVTSSIATVDHVELAVTVPTKTTYDFNEKLDLTGLVVKKVSYDASDNVLEETELTSDQYTIKHASLTLTNGMALTVAGDMKVNVALVDDTSVKSQFVIHINDVTEVFSLAVTAPTKTSYKFNEALDLTGLKVEKVGTKNGYETSRTTLTSEQYTLSHHGFTIENGVKMPVSGDMKVTVTSKDDASLTGSFVVTVGEGTWDRALNVKTMPTKTTYADGEKFDASGLVVELVSKITPDGEETVIEKTDLTSSDYTITINNTPAANYVFHPTANGEEITVTITSTSRKIKGTTFVVTGSVPEVKYSIAVSGDEMMDLQWWIGEKKTAGTGINIKENIDDIDAASFSKGTIVGFTITNDTSAYVEWGDWTISGASIYVADIGNDENLYDSFYFEVKESNVSIDFEATLLYPYAGKDFLGEYTVYLINEKTTPHTLEVNRDGKLYLDGEEECTYTYNEESGTFSLSGSYNKFAINGNAVMYGKYFGYQDAEDILILNDDNSTSSFMAVVTIGEEQKIYWYDDPSDVDGFITEDMGVKFNFDGETLETSTRLVVTAPVVDGDSVMSTDIWWPAYPYLDTESDPNNHQMIISLDMENQLYEKLENDGLVGTYQGENGELTLDGYGQYTLGDKKGTYILNKNYGYITLDNETSYLLNSDDKTYSIFEIAEIDPWLETSMSYTYDSITLTFSNGKVTLTDSERTWEGAGEAVSYTFNRGKVTFQVLYGFDYEYYEDLYGTFEFIVTPTSLLLGDDVEAGSGWGAETIAYAGAVFTLVSE